MHTLAVIAMLGAACASAASSTTAESDAAPPRSSRSFIDQAIATIRHTVAGITTLVAEATVVQRAPGMSEPVTAESRIEITAPGVLRKDVRGQYPFCVSVSNGVVTTEFPGTKVRDVRQLGAREDLMADFLGMCTFPDEADYSFEFAVEGPLHVVAAELRPRPTRELARSIVANAGVAVRRTLWINPATRQIVKTRRVTLGQGEETCEFRSLWINKSAPAVEK